MSWGKSSRITYALEKTSERILFFGSSRAYTHYVPEVFEGKLRRESYNVGHDAAGMLFHNALLKGILTRYRPETIVLDFRPDELAKNARSLQMLSVLLPYYRDHPEIRTIIRLRSPAERLKLLSRIYPFNSQLLTILLANRIRWADDHGFVAAAGTMDRPLAGPDPAPREGLDPVAGRAFLEFLDLAQRTASPFWSSSLRSTRFRQDRPASIRTAEAICRRRNIPFFDYSRDDRFLKRPDLFHDPDHLNAEGAKLFSEILSDRILRSGTEARPSVPPRR